MDDSPEVMNSRDACIYLGITRDTLYKYALTRQIPAFKMGNRWKFKKSTLDRWMEEKSSVTRSRYHRQHASERDVVRCHNYPSQRFTSDGHVSARRQAH